jgi:hypothetical protein
MGFCPLCPGIMDLFYCTQLDFEDVGNYKEKKRRGEERRGKERKERD